MELVPIIVSMFLCKTYMFSIINSSTCNFWYVTRHSKNESIFLLYFNCR